VAFTRSRIYNPWDPLLYKDSNPGAPKSLETEAFRTQYCLEPKASHIGPDGLRITVPASDSDDIILVVGDSIAYIQRSLPDLFRQEDVPFFMLACFDLKEQTLELAEEAGFQIVDQWPLIDQWRVEAGTPFAGFSLYVDHCHY